MGLTKAYVYVVMIDRCMGAVCYVCMLCMSVMYVTDVKYVT